MKIIAELTRKDIQALIDAVNEHDIAADEMIEARDKLSKALKVENGYCFNCGHDLSVRTDYDE